MKRLFTIVAGLAALPAPAMAAPFQDLDALERRLLIALGADIGMPGGPIAPIDRRMKLAPCPSPVTIDPPLLGAVALRCPTAGWRIRVPLMRAATAAAPAAESRPVALVRRGDPVELFAGSGSFSVSAQAIAQEDGARGARIRVKVDPKSQPIYAEVVDSGLVRVAGFK
ncbi:flagellar protein [Sphingomonas oleivorans]|uniref:Flagellar protein n=1 Tax=Sphingomonas oleivorans TaxID=1735121 RepID=A0A2T5FUF0_9SPHN|nr:flagella basal body P-ring formation protein FlgA [Sphingomonas oleivorans]PTQ08150.1 flagellar protein [Sphingomonas oleivorans]